MKFSFCDILFFRCDFQVMLKRYIIIKFFLLKEVLFIKYYYYYITLFRSNSHNQYVCCMSRKFFCWNGKFVCIFVYISLRENKAPVSFPRISKIQNSKYENGQKNACDIAKDRAGALTSLFLFDKRKHFLYTSIGREGCACVYNK